MPHGRARCVATTDPARLDERLPLVNRPPPLPDPVVPDAEPWTARDEAFSLRVTAGAAYALLAYVVAVVAHDVRLTVVVIVLVPVIVVLWLRADRALARAARKAARR
jgi:hypothetical protein